MPKLNLQEVHFGSVAPTGDRIKPDHTEKTLFPFICEAITLPAYDEIPYVFDLEEREYLEFTSGRTHLSTFWSAIWRTMSDGLTRGMTPK
jgi:hypothetical protein